jgi:hypothetical protein
MSKRIYILLALLLLAGAGLGVWFGTNGQQPAQEE